MKKRLISLLVVLVMVLTANTYVFAGVTDDTPLNLLKELGILEASDLEKSPDDLINRGDFTTLLVKATGMNKNLVPSSGIQYFYDVNPEDKNAGYIEHAYKLGITNGIGDGLFGAKLNIKQGEALALCIRALKYNIIMKNPATLSDYMAFGTQMKLNADISGGYDMELTYGDTYHILYRMMTTEFLEIYEKNNGDVIQKAEPSESYLTTIFGIKSFKGIVNNTPYAAKDKSEYTEIGRVEIGDTLFNVGQTNAEQLFGYRVTAYYRETESGNELVWVDESPTSSVKLSTHEVVDYKPLVLTYVDANKNKEYRIAEDAVTVVNGSVVHVTDSFEFPVTGFVELFDDNDDKTYDIVKITSYDVVIAGGVDVSKKIILDSKDSRNHIKLDDVEYYSITDMDGNVVELSDISKGSILHVEGNADEQFINIVVIEDIVNMTVGTIKSVNERSRIMSVSNKETGDEYYVSRIYSNIGENPKIVSGGMYTFKLDIHGDIILGEISNTTMEYGYLKAYAEGKTFENPRFRIFTDDGEFVTVSSAKKVNFFDGTSSSSKPSTDIVSVIDNVFANTTLIELPCIVRYKLNSKGELSTLELPGAVGENGGFRSVGSAGKDYAARYNVGSKTIGGYIIVNDNTKFFNIPIDESDEAAYTVTDLSEIKNNQYLYGAVGYSAESVSNVAQAVVVPTSTLNQAYSFVVFREMAKEMDVETQEVYDTVLCYEDGREKSYRIASSIETLEVIDDETLQTHEMHTGDYIALFKDADGQVVRARTLFDIELERAYKAYNDKSTGSTNKIMNNKETGLSVTNRVDCGLITSIKDGYMQINNNGQFTLGEYFYVPESTTVFIIDKDDTHRELEIGTISDIMVDGTTGIFTKSSVGATQEVVVVKNWKFVQGGDENFEQGENQN